MKTIVGEYPIEIVESSNSPILYRFNPPIRSFNPTEIKFKPVCGYTEVIIPFPQKNISALKLKSLNAANMVFKSFPERPNNYFFAKIKSGKIILSKISSLYMFESAHQYYSVDLQSQSLKKAESREELEHRRKSINFKLKMVENEEFKKFEYDQTSKIDDDRFIQKQNVDEIEKSPEVSLEPVNTTPITPEPNVSKPINFAKIEETIKNARVVNFEKLVEMFENRNAIISVLYKMTICIAGRFVLKNGYYEKRLWSDRSKLLEMFKRNGEANVSDTRFLGCEQWMAEELCELKERKYILKGYKESLEFDAESIHNTNKLLVKQSLEIEKMQNTRSLSEKLCIDEEIIANIVKSEEFIHLANNCFAVNNENYWFNCCLKLFDNKRTVDFSEIQEVLLKHEQEKTTDEVINELKIFCNHRGTKYTIKTPKE